MSINVINPNYGRETYKNYRERIQEQVKSGKISLSDLSFENYSIYCMGSGYYDGVDPNSLVSKN